MTNWTLRLFLLVLLTSLTTPAQTLGPKDQAKGRVGRDIEVRCLYPSGKFFSYDTLFPLVLEYHNISGTKQEFALKWSLDQKIPADYRSVVLEPGAKKRIPLLFPPRTVGQLYSLEVNGYNLNPGLTANSQGLITGVLASGGESFDYLKSLQVENNPYFNSANQTEDDEYTTPQALSIIEPEVFPEHWGALASLQTIICHDLTALSLSRNQYEAIVNWVRQGGKLVVVSNGIPNEYQSTPLAALLPFKPEGVDSKGKMLRVTGKPTPDAAILYGEKNAPLLLSHNLMNGKVCYITSPLLDPDKLGKDDTVALWKFIFRQPNYNSSNAFSYNNTGGIASYPLLDKMPELPRAQAGWVALYVLLYGVIVGPVNLSLLRKKDKMLWSFASVPLVALLFAGGAYVVNSVIRPSNPVMRELGWFHLRPGDAMGVTESEQILFSPRSSDYVVSSDGKTVFDVFTDTYGAYSQRRQFEMYDLTPDGGLESYLHMGTWDIQRFRCRSVLEVEHPFLIEVSEDHTSVTIDSPLESDGETACLTLPKLGTTQAFKLKKGKESYKITFSDSNSPSSVCDFQTEDNPGRPELTNSAGTYYRLKEGSGRLFLWTHALETPVKTDQGGSFQHDFLVGVEFEP